MLWRPPSLKLRRAADRWRDEQRAAGGPAARGGRPGVSGRLRGPDELQKPVPGRLRRQQTVCRRGGGRRQRRLPGQSGPVLTAPGSAASARFVTVRARPGPFRPVKPASSGALVRPSLPETGAPITGHASIMQTVTGDTVFTITTFSGTAQSNL